MIQRPLQFKTAVVLSDAKDKKNNVQVVQIVLWVVDSGCSKHMTGDDLLTGGHDSNLYTISISDMAASSPICLMSKATLTKSWLWHRRLGKSKKASHPPKLIPSDYSKLELLHMDLCGPMRVASVNGKKYILVIVDDFSRFTWVYFLRSKDETLEIIKKFIAQAHVKFDELTAIASEHDCLEPELQRFNNQNSSDDLMNTPSKEDLDNLFGPTSEEQTSPISLQESDEFNQEDSAYFD
ncbi:integrase, catalytic region, zinc finger, CCHC-type containing protein, partial [Tanacetum coccineum]